MSDPRREYIIFRHTSTDTAPQPFTITDPHRTVLPLQCDSCGERPTYVARMIQQCIFKLGCECGRYVMCAVHRIDTPLVNGAARSWLAAEWNRECEPIGHSDDYREAGGDWCVFVPPVAQSVVDEIDRLTTTDPAIDSESK